MKDQSDDRAPAARAAGIASQVIAVAMEMVLPGLLGHFLDRRTGTGVLFLLIGVALGLITGIWHLIRMANELSPKRSGREDEEEH